MSARRKSALTLPVMRFFNRKPANLTTNLVKCPGWVFGSHSQQWVALSSHPLLAAQFLVKLDFDFDIHTGRQAETHQHVDRL